MRFLPPHFAFSLPRRGCFGWPSTLRGQSPIYLGGGNLGTLGNVTPALLTSGTVAVGTSLAIATTAGHDFQGQTLTNNRRIDWSGGRIRGGDGSVLINNATFNDAVTTATDVNNDWGDHQTTFTNALGATYLKTGSTTTRFLGVPLYNNGTVMVQAGTLELNGGGTTSGTGRFDVATGGHVLFSNSYTLQAGATLAGTGDYHATGGQLSVSGMVHVQNLNLDGGLDLAAGTVTGNFMRRSGA